MAEALVTVRDGCTQTERGFSSDRETCKRFAESVDRKSAFGGLERRRWLCCLKPKLPDLFEQPGKPCA